MNFSRLASIAVLSAALSACSSSTQPFQPSGTAANPTGKTAGSVDSWHRSLAQNRLPGAGCFKATYPAAEWSRIACATPPQIWFPVPTSRLPRLGQAVGDGLDFTADASPNLISTAIGAFPKVRGVKSVQSEGGSGNGLNDYTIQLNSYFFQSSACGSIKNCVGWEQFVFANPTGTGQASLFIQDWLVATVQSGLTGCPPGKGWQFVGIGCVQNSPFGVNIPNVSITDLKQLIETGTASTSGDSIFLSVGGTEYGMKNVQGDGIVDLAPNWKGAEFNVIGGGGGSRADFNAGSKITVNLQTDTGLRKKPTCPADSGTTGESNNLFFVNAPLKPAKRQFPSIDFTMSSTNSGNASCDTVRGT